MSAIQPPVDNKIPPPFFPEEKEPLKSFSTKSPKFRTWFSQQEKNKVYKLIRRDVRFT